MKVLIFTEGGKSIGLGHISRCSSLYDEIKRRNIDVKLVINGDIDNTKLLEGKNFEKSNWSSLSYVKNNVTVDDYCIIDSYLADLTIYEEIQKRCKKAMYLDDYNRLNYPSGIIVNPAIDTNTLGYNNTLLLGHKFTILRKAFCEIFQRKVEDIGTTINVLIIIGGTDPNKLSKLIYTHLSTFHNTYFHIVTSNSEEYASIDNVTTYHNLNDTDMRNLMLSCDVAITAAGQTIFELMITKLPFVCIKVAPNQSNNINRLMKNNVIISKIDINDDDFIEKIKKDYEQLLNRHIRKSIIKNMDNIIDKYGCVRIIDYLLTNNSLAFRPAKEDDCQLIFQWANDKDVRRNAFTTGKIDYSTHINWFKNKLNSSSSKIFIFQHNNISIGQLRLDFDNNIATLSYSLDKDYRGYGFGKEMVLEIIKYLRTNDNSCKTIHALVKYENIPSQKVFEKIGFEKIEEQEFLKYIKIL